MSNRLKVCDANTLAGDESMLVLDFLTERITVRELIRSRVYQEVKDYNTRQPEYFRGLVQPTAAEQTLNGFRLRTPRQLDWQKQFEKAIAFSEKPGYCMSMIDDLTRLRHMRDAATEAIQFISGRTRA